MRTTTICVALSLVTLQHAARADVFEVDEDGAMAVRANAAGVIAASDLAAANDVEQAPDVPAGAVTTIDPPAAPAAFQASLRQAADTAHVSPSLLAALVWRESRWHPAALSAKGARGLTQLMPRTARTLAVDPGDAAANLAGGARYLRSMLDMFDGNIERALAAYNAGPARVLRSPGLPAISETRAYVSSIIDRLGTPVTSMLEGAKP